jgi:hypothetical protein
MRETERFWGPPQPIRGAGRRKVEYLRRPPERWSLEVNRDGLADLEVGERDAFGDPVEVDELREAEHEWIEANAAVNGIDYEESFRVGIETGTIGAVR